MEKLYIKFEEGNEESLNTAVLKAESLGYKKRNIDNVLDFEGYGVLILDDSGYYYTSTTSEEIVSQSSYKKYIGKIITTEENITFEGGAIREDKENKIRYDLIPLELLESIAQKYTDGAKQYGENNWRKGDEAFAEGCKASAFRHFIQWLRGDNDEDHKAAATWNMYTYDILKEKQEKQIEDIENSLKELREKK